MHIIIKVHKTKGKKKILKAKLNINKRKNDLNNSTLSSDIREAVEENLSTQNSSSSENTLCFIKKIKTNCWHQMYSTD